MRRSCFELTKEQVAFVKKNWKKKSNSEMSKSLDIKFSTFSNKLHKMGLFRMQCERWTQEQVDFLKKNYQTIGDKELAILFNGFWDKDKRWSFKHIEKKRRYLNLKRTKKQIDAIKLRNIKRGCWAEMGTWNTRGACPDGTIKIWRSSWPSNRGRVKHRFKVIKVKGRFVHYARWFYEKEFGKMPAGYVVGFKDRDNMNVVPENIESITRAEHARRNYGNLKYPDEIRELDRILKQLNQTLKQKQ